MGWLLLGVLIGWVGGVWRANARAEAEAGVAALRAKTPDYSPIRYVATIKDVDALRWMAENAGPDEGASGDGWSSDAMLEARSRIASLAERLSAALPPREEKP